MKTAVLDASVVGAWFFREGRSSTRAEFERGELFAAVPPLLFVELLNVAGRQLRWKERSLHDLADRLGRLHLEVVEPDLARAAPWVARGLTAYDACYVALAEQLGVPLLTFDGQILSTAAQVAVAPSDRPR